MSAPDTPNTDALFDFPCDFPIKVMGPSHPDFHDTASPWCASMTPNSMCNASRRGRRRAVSTLA